MIATPFGFRIVGGCAERRRLVDQETAFLAYAACDARAEVEREGYLSAFTFEADFRQHLERTGTTKDFVGLCGAPWLWMDIDCPNDLRRAAADAWLLANGLMDRYRIATDSLLVFFSGSKGFHVGLPCSLWNPPPSADFHRITRRFCETVAQAVGIEIDVSIYDKVQAFRAPNSRHPKTGLHKVRLTLEELLEIEPAEILSRAMKPSPFEVPASTADDAHADRLATDWQEAAAQVRGQAEAKAARPAGDSVAILNRRTMDFIHNGAAEGDRARLLFSAAANLAEFGCPPALAHSLLSESALDSGLSPSEVRRQIDCGLEHKRVTP